MRKKITCLILLMIALLVSSCSPRQIQTTSQTPIATAAASETPIPEPSASVDPTATKTQLPPLTVSAGQYYFSLDGQPVFLLSRNLTGKTREDFTALLEYARQGGTKLLRIHVTHGWWGDPWINQDWTVNEIWAQNWDWFFTQAEESGIYIMPVFGVWAEWNNGKPDLGNNWQYSPLNRANGGPLDSPVGLFEPDSDIQKLWLTWVETLVKRWQERSNIAAWELFSEINIASGGPGYSDSGGAVSAEAATNFTNTAAAVVRAADEGRRPITLSLAVAAPLTNEWGAFYQNNTLDFIQIHPYINTLDRELVSVVRANIDVYNKPVMIGESGLWSFEAEAKTTLGIEHAIWAGLVSGAMNGRGLWANDGYAIYTTDDRSFAFEYLQQYAATELPVVNFTRDVDFTGFKPLDAASTSGIWGAAVGNESTLLGWYRDAACESPDYPLQPVLSKQSVTITVPGKASDWKVDFYSTDDGVTLLSSINVSQKGNTIKIPLPDFTDDIAFKAAAQ